MRNNKQKKTNRGINCNSQCLYFESCKFVGYVGVWRNPVHPDTDQDKVLKIKIMFFYTVYKVSLYSVPIMEYIQIKVELSWQLISKVQSKVSKSNYQLSTFSVHL